MNKYLLKLESQEEVVDFVNMMGKADVYADLKCGSIIVDACSLLGVLALGVDKVAELITYGEIDKDIEKRIEKYCVA